MIQQRILIRLMLRRERRPPARIVVPSSAITTRCYRKSLPLTLRYHVTCSLVVEQKKVDLPVPFVQFFYLMPLREDLSKLTDFPFYREIVSKISGAGT